MHPRGLIHTRVPTYLLIEVTLSRCGRRASPYSQRRFTFRVRDLHARRYFHAGLLAQKFQDEFAHRSGYGSKRAIRSRSSFHVPAVRTRSGGDMHQRQQEFGSRGKQLVYDSLRLRLEGRDPGSHCCQTLGGTVARQAPSAGGSWIVRPGTSKGASANAPLNFFKGRERKFPFESPVRTRRPEVYR